MISVTTKLSLALRMSNNARLTPQGILLIIFSLFILLTINKTYALSHSVTPIKKPSLIELIGEKFYSPNEKIFIFMNFSKKLIITTKTLNFCSILKINM
jgi:hypothetical protein